MLLTSLVASCDGALVPMASVRSDLQVSGVMVTDLLDPRRYLAGGELVLTGLIWWRPSDPDRTRAFVTALAASGVTAVGAGLAQLGRIPDDLIEACDEAGLALLCVPVDRSFTAITNQVARHRFGLGGLTAALARYRNLVAGEADGLGLRRACELVGAEMGLRVWVLSPSGRLMAGSDDLADDEGRRELARRFPSGQAPFIVRRRDRPTLSIFRPVTRALPWSLVVEGTAAALDADRRAVVDELLQLVALESQRSLRPTDAQRQLAAALAGTSALDLESALRPSGLEPARSAVVVLVGGRLAAAVLQEMLSMTAIPCAVGLAEPDAVEAFAVLSTKDTIGLTEQLRELLAGLRNGLGADDLRVAVSDAVTGGAAVLAAVNEVRALLLMPGQPPHSVIGPDQLSSHAMIVAGLPPELRAAYHDRVLGALLAHDRTHRSDLVRTLRTYLDCSASVSQCAARMHLHVNTLRYRIERIEAITGRNLRHLPEQSDLLLAFAMDPTSA